MDISRLDDAARAHGEAFGEIRPASTFVAVTALGEAEMLVEIAATAIVQDAVTPTARFLPFYWTAASASTSPWP